MKVYTLNALKSFVCTGPDCIRNCCYYWNVEIDDKTLETWENMENADDRAWLQQGIEYQADKNRSVVRFICKDSKEPECGFLDENRFCAIQKKFGHETIPKTCQIFPRIEYKNEDIEYYTASLSCPEILKESIENKKQPLFSADSTSNSVSSGQQLILAQLDELLRHILTLSKFPIGVRLFYLSMIISDLMQATDSGQLQQDDIPSLQKASKQNLYDINLAHKNKQLTIDPVTAGSFWRTIYYLLETRGIADKFREESDSPLCKLLSEEQDSTEHFLAVYEMICQYRNQNRKQFAEQHRETMQRFLQLYFINQGFSIHPTQDNHLIALVVAMIGLSIIQLMIWTTMKKNGSIDSNLLQEIIVEVHRKYVHSDVVAENLKNDSHMLQIARYAHCLLDLF